MTRQGLATRSAAAPAGGAAAAVGLQAQDIGAARLGVRARSAAVDEAAVVNAIQHGRRGVRTGLMRSTVHLVAAEDLRWMAALYGPVMERNHRTRWRNLGITEPMIETALAHAPGLLAARGLERGRDGQVPTHVLAALTARGLTCRGADRGRDATFVLIEDWVAPAPAAPDPAPPDPLGELARRYFRAFGPATAADFATWSGLPSGAAIAAIRDELTEVGFDRRRGWTLGAVEPAPAFRLLPMFDNYLLGYRDRTAMLDPGRHPQVYVGGIIKASVVCDGRVIGIWRLERTARKGPVRGHPS